MKTGTYHWFQSLLFVLAFVLGMQLKAGQVYGQTNLAATIDTLIERDFESFIGKTESDGPLLRRLSLEDRKSVV